MIAIREKQKEINATDVEHMGALLTGGLLVVAGWKRGGFGGSLFRLAGYALIFRGQKGYRRLYDALGLRVADRPSGTGVYNIDVRAEIVVGKPRQELYRIWRNFENLPVFMDHLLSVHELDDTRSIWVARAPAGTVIKWEARIVNDVENELIAWETMEGSGVDHVGSVSFEPEGDDSTRIRIKMRYDPPAEMLGYWVAKLFRNDPQTQIEKDLRRFKAIMELGSRQEAAKSKPQASVI